MARLVALGWALLIFFATSLPAEQAQPTDLIDGATLKAKVRGKDEVVRLVGVRAADDQGCLAGELGALASSLGTLELERDLHLPSRANGLLVRYASWRGEDLSYRMVFDGLARALEGPYRLMDLYVGAEASARHRRVGMWSEACGGVQDGGEGRDEGGSAPSSVEESLEDRTCCRLCTTGIACGDACLPPGRTCRLEAGCACNAR